MCLAVSLYKFWRVSLSPCISVVQTGIQVSWFLQLKKMCHSIDLFHLSHAQVYLWGILHCIELYIHARVLFVVANPSVAFDNCKVELISKRPPHLISHDYRVRFPQNRFILPIKILTTYS